MLREHGWRTRPTHGPARLANVWSSDARKALGSPTNEVVVHRVRPSVGSGGEGLAALPRRGSRRGRRGDPRRLLSCLRCNGVWVLGGAQGRRLAAADIEVETGSLEGFRNGRERPKQRLALRPMRVLIEDPTFLNDLCAHFRRAGFTADPVDEGMADVDRPDAPTPQQAAAEIRVHLQLWRILNPDQRAELVPSS